MAKAVLEIFVRELLLDGSIIQMKIWRLPFPDPERPHGYKYSLFYGRRGRRIVGYDNERGKGDHRHLGDREEAYTFTSVEALMRDFKADIRRARRSL
jgi:hypothetical protein